MGSLAVNRTIIAFLAAAAPVLFAQAPAPTKIGAINIQAAMTGTKDGQRASQELAAKLEPRKREIEAEAAEIRGLQEKLQRGGAAMSDAARQDLTHQIDEKTKRYNRDMEDAQADLRDENTKLIEDLSAKMTQVIDKYAQENGFAIVFDVSNPNGAVLYTSNMVDITRDIVELYDKAHPVSAPAGKPATPGITPLSSPATRVPTKKQP